jgi:protein phosphatase
MIRAAETVQLTDTGRQRRENEDSVYARAPVFVVADGMGGAQAGEVASRIAVEAFERGLPDGGSPEERLATLVRDANRRIHELSRAEHERAGMGTTLTAALLDDAELAIAHVGDSRAYLYRAGELRRLTQDHSLVQELVDRGKLTEAQAEEHPQRSIITRALGPEPTVKVDTRTYPVRDGDVLLLCSDGLTSMISEEKIAEVLGAGSRLDRAADRLIAEANAAGGRDNITVVLTRFEEVGDGAGDAPTMVGVRAGADPAPDPDTPAAPASAGAAPASAGAPPLRARAAPRRLSPLPAPIARRAPGAQEARRPAPARRQRYAKPLAALTAVIVVLALVIGGGYLATRQLYFIGTNAAGIVTIYRGLPYDLPAGIHLYETFYVSGVPAQLVPPTRRKTLLNDDLRSQNDAESLVHALELGRLSG